MMRRVIETGDPSSDVFATEVGLDLVVSDFDTTGPGATHGDFS